MSLISVVSSSISMITNRDKRMQSELQSKNKDGVGGHGKSALRRSATNLLLKNFKVLSSSRSSFIGSSSRSSLGARSVRPSSHPAPFSDVEAVDLRRQLSLREQGEMLSSHQMGREGGLGAANSSIIGSRSRKPLQKSVVDHARVPRSNRMMDHTRRKSSVGADKHQIENSAPAKENQQASRREKQSLKRRTAYSKFF